MRLDRDGELRVGDLHSFWFYAGSWMLRVSLIVAVFKLVGTLSWASMRGYGARLDFWFGVIPHFDLQLAEDRFVRLVTLSTWLGIVGAVVGLLWALSQARHISALHLAYRNWVVDHYADQVAQQYGLPPTRDAVHDDDVVDRRVSPARSLPPGVPAEDELLRFDRFTEHAARRGLWLGAWLGSLTLLVTIVFEIFRHIVSSAYVVQTQHLIATVVAAIPAMALLAMVAIGSFRAVLPIEDVDVLLTAAGVELESPDESRRRPGGHGSAGVGDTFPDAPLTAALGS